MKEFINIETIDDFGPRGFKPKTFINLNTKNIVSIKEMENNTSFIVTDILDPWGQVKYYTTYTKYVQELI